MTVAFFAMGFTPLPTKANTVPFSDATVNVFAIGSGGLRIGTGPPPSPGPGDSPRNGLVVVPDTVGMTFDEGIAAARAAGLDWTVACDTQPDRPEEIYAQEPAAGQQVAPGSRFTMFFPRYEGYCDGG